MKKLLVFLFVILSTQYSSDTVAFTIKYRVYGIGDPIPSTWQFCQTIQAGIVPYTTGTIHQMSKMEYIDMTGKTESTMIDILLYRSDAGGAGALGTEVIMKEFDIHYMVDKFGNYENY